MSKSTRISTLANEPIDFPQSTTPHELESATARKVYRLIQYKFTEYFNLLYIIDVPEEAVKQLDGSDLVGLVRASGIPGFEEGNG